MNHENPVRPCGRAGFLVLEKGFKKQSRRMSLAESLTNVVIGYAVAVASQVAIFPAFGIHVPLKTNLSIGLWFTGVSIVRSYVIRRVFNR